MVQSRHGRWWRGLRGELSANLVGGGRNVWRHQAKTRVDVGKRVSRWRQGGKPSANLMGGGGRNVRRQQAKTRVNVGEKRLAR